MRARQSQAILPMWMTLRSPAVSVAARAASAREQGTREAVGANPTRTCVGCSERAPRELLVRLVRDARGIVEVDARGRAPGRGAWIHDRRACVDAAISAERL